MVNKLKFKIFLENYLVSLYPKDIYNFYYIFSAHSYGKMYDEDKSRAEFLLNEIKNKYLVVFKDVLIQQLKKYSKQNRTDIDFDQKSINPNMDFRTIHSLMSKTYRSDMSRRNINWEMLAEYCMNLSGTGVFDKICFYIDRINNSVHNSGELFFDKLENANDLLKAFDTVHLSATPRDYARFVGSEVRKLARWI
jgi:hypothetical protein